MSADIPLSEYSNIQRSVQLDLRSILNSLLGANSRIDCESASNFDLSGRIAAQATMVELCAESKPGTVGLPTRRMWTAGKLPGLVLTRYDLLGTYVHGRLQYTYQ